jgi:hypothetical protein
MRTEGQRDMKLTVACRKFVNAPENVYEYLVACDRIKKIYKKKKRGYGSSSKLIIRCAMPNIIKIGPQTV